MSDEDAPLTAEDLRTGRSAAIECRGIIARYAVQHTAFMAALGLLLVGMGYAMRGNVSPWAFTLPVVLAATVAPRPLRELRRLSKLIAEFEAAERTVAAGGTVRARDLPSLGTLPTT